MYLCHGVLDSDLAQHHGACTEHHTLVDDGDAQFLLGVGEGGHEAGGDILCMSGGWPQECDDQRRICVHVWTSSRMLSRMLITMYLMHT